MAIAKIWRNRLEAGTQIWSECPERYRLDVMMLLKEDVKNGKISKEKYQEITGEEYF